MMRGFLWRRKSYAAFSPNLGTYVAAVAVLSGACMQPPPDGQLAILMELMKGSLASLLYGARCLRIERGNQQLRTERHEQDGETSALQTAALQGAGPMTARRDTCPGAGKLYSGKAAAWGADAESQKPEAHHACSSDCI